MARPPSPMVSTMAESPRSGLASAGPKPGKKSPSGVSTGAVNQRRPHPATRIPNSVPFRAMAVTMVEPGTSPAASVAALAAAMARLRKN